MFHLIRVESQRPVTGLTLFKSLSALHTLVTQSS